MRQFQPAVQVAFVAAGLHLLTWEAGETSSRSPHELVGLARLCIEQWVDEDTRSRAALGLTSQRPGQMT